MSPGLAVARAWQSRHGRHSVLWVGRRGGIEERMAGEAGLEFRGVESRPFRRSLSPANLRLPFSLVQGFLQAWRLAEEAAPDAVLMTGGYAGVPLCLATALKGRPLVLLELDSVPGLANRLFAGAASALCLGQPGPDRRRNAVHTGTPVRFSRLPGRAQSRRAFGLRGKDPVLLVIPGSGAAHSINLALMQGLRRLKEVQLLWMCGPKDLQEVSRAARAHPAAQVRAFIQDVPAAYAAADLVLARSGASMLAEIALAGKPSILVPYPHATGDHQRKNAAHFAEAGAARVILDQDLGGDRLSGEITALLSRPSELRNMASAARKLARPDAAQRVAGVLERAAKGFRHV